MDSACFASVSKGLGIRKCEQPNAFFVFLLIMHVLLQFLKGRIAGNLKNQMLSYMFFSILHVSCQFFLIQIWENLGIRTLKNLSETCKTKRKCKKAIGFLGFLKSKPLKTEAKHAEAKKASKKALGFLSFLKSETSKTEAKHAESNKH